MIYMCLGLYNYTNLVKMHVTDMIALPCRLFDILFILFDTKQPEDIN